MNYKRIETAKEYPYTSAEYYTDKGYLKFDRFTKSFYSEGSSISVKYWFKEIESFEEVTEVVMKYLSENHHPHTMIQIESNSTQLFEGVKSHLTDKYLKD
ncbi:hypothetical protein HZP37_18160 [Elizabethkingia anophelis]|nr:hypothetical protein [Elizabethkingia anophelis]